MASSDVVQRLTVGFAHQIGNEVTVISAATTLLRRRLENDPEVETILEGVERVSNLCNGLRRLVRECGEPAVFDPNPVVARIAETLDVLLAGRLRVSTELDPSCGLLIRTVPTDLELAVAALVLVWDRSLDPSAAIRVRTLAGTEHVTIAVTSNAEMPELDAPERAKLEERARRAGATLVVTTAQLLLRFTSVA